MVESYWEERASSYSVGVCEELASAKRSAWKKTLKRILSQADRPIEELSVLDLGCGPGFLSILCAELGCHVTAVDSSSQMLGHAGLNALGSGVSHGIEFVKGDASSLPFEGGSFDAVVNRNVTWLMQDPVAAYLEWKRVLRPNGRLAVFDANWYRYLDNPSVNAIRLASQADPAVLEWPEEGLATAEQERRCERIAGHLPSTYVLRPDWDAAVLQALGFEDVCCNVDIWRRLWTEGEQAYYGSSPLFLIEARKA